MPRDFTQDFPSDDSRPRSPIGGAPVGRLDDLGAIEARAVRLLRLWCDAGFEAVAARLAPDLDPGPASAAARALDALARLCATTGRRPLMRHAADCACLGADEAWFARLIGHGSEAAGEEAMMLAMAFLRPEAAAEAAYLAEALGLGLRRAGISRRRLH
ncbi:hypothetical protein CLV79_10877 [Limimaricola soesokkakensis]|uniref:Uncharacterized protein n=1 Tax=Limimaricola soesokkakensis TaxID=1343159 RepID=A0A1X6ZJI8_9RHOB|nr:hypothetical protein [Limimaricola soesokkakensis]PSK84910.1 hypothetical protein CLV79_10877 [Limimaricola soesokkakensis]SLN52900.1 hypothetical protein LOS8367_02458 [Limimaricola soesokkakensis]